MPLKLKFLALNLFLIGVINTTTAQSVFQKSYFINSLEQLNCIIQTQDGGFAAVGQSLSTGNDNDIWFLKTNANGDVEFSKTYSTSGNETATSLKQLPNGDYLLCGNTTSAAAVTNQIFVCRIDLSGNIIWSKTYDAIKNEVAKSLIVTANNEILVAGYTTSVGIAYPKGLLLALDLNGNQIWSKVYTQINTEIFNKVLQTSDGGYLAVGSIVLFGNTDKDIVVTKVDNVGNYQWSYSYGDLSDEEAFDAVQVGTNYYIAGATASAGAGSQDFYMLQLAANGSVLNGRTVGTGLSETAYSISLFDPSTLVISGYSELSISAPVREVGTILKSDLNLNFFQAIYLGDTMAQSRVVSSIVTNIGKVAMAGFYIPQGQTGISGFIAQNNLSYSQVCNEYYPSLMAATYLPNSNTQNYFAPALLSEQNLTLNPLTPVSFINSICFTTDVAENNKAIAIHVSPNPASHFLKVLSNAKDPNAAIKISSVTGEVLITLNLYADNTIDVSSLKAGVYFAEITSGNYKYYSKFVKL